MFSFVSRVSPVVIVLVVACACDSTTVPDAELASPNRSEPPENSPVLKDTPPIREVTDETVRAEDPEPALPEFSQPKSVDASRRLEGDVVLKAFFVNPTQRIEVAACHRTGPLHETIVAFEEAGDALYERLLKNGFRPPRFWNATGKDELRRHLGDRAIVHLEWKSTDGVVSYPIDCLLREIDTGFPLFIRGFTFAAEKRPMGDPPENRVPRSVEFTIGDPTRRGSVSTILFHPQDLDALTHWVAPVEVSPKVVAGLPDLSENRVEAAIVIRRVRSEVELIDVAKSVRASQPEWQAMLESLRPLAQRIDVLKEQYEKRVKEIEGLIGAGGTPDEATKAAQVAMLVRQGRLDVAQIYETYLDLFEVQEKFKVRMLSERRELAADIREFVRARYTHGFAYEPRLAALQRQIAEIEAKGSKLTAADALLIDALKADAQRLPIERQIYWASDALREVEARVSAESDAYTRALFLDEKLRINSDLREFGAIIELRKLEAEEARARAEGRLVAADSISSRRQRAELQLALADLEKKLVDVDADVRRTQAELEWADENENPKEKLHKRLQEEKSARGVLEGKIEALRTQLKSSAQSH